MESMELYQSAQKSSKWTSVLLRLLAVAFAFSLLDVLYTLTINLPVGSILPEFPLFSFDSTESTSAGGVAHAIFVLFLGFFTVFPLTILFYVAAFFGVMATFFNWIRRSLANLGTLGMATQSLPIADDERQGHIPHSGIWKIQRTMRSLWNGSLDSEAASLAVAEPRRLRFLGRLWLLALPALLGNLYTWLDSILFWFARYSTPSGSSGFTYLVDIQLNGLALQVALWALTVSSFALVVACIATASLVKGITENQEKRHARLISPPG